MSKSARLDERWELAFRADHSARYHRRRATFLLRFDQALSLLVLFCSAGAFVSVLDYGPAWIAQSAALIIALVAVLQIIFQFGIASTRHAEWLRRWNRLATEIRCTPSPNSAYITKWIIEKNEIESDCVGELRALAIDCENATLRWFGVESGLRKIARPQRLFIHFGTFQQNFPLVDRTGARIEE